MLKFVQKLVPVTSFRLDSLLVGTSWGAMCHYAPIDAAVVTGILGGQWLRGRRWNGVRDVKDVERAVSAFKTKKNLSDLRVERQKAQNWRIIETTF